MVERRIVSLVQWLRLTTLVLACIIIVFPHLSCGERTITVKEHQCTNKSECSGKNYVIYQVIAAGENDTIQYLWSTVGVPSIVVAYFNKIIPQATLKINWTALLSKKPSKSVLFEPASDYMASVAFTSIYEFSDPKNKVYLDENSKSAVRHSLDEALWEKHTRLDDSIDFKGSFLNGSIGFKCTAAADDGRDTTLPHQSFSQNMTRFWLSLDNLVALNTVKTRLAIEIQSLTEKYTRRKATTCLQAKKSIDDEYTPSIFKTIFLKVSSSSTQDQSFVSWKPVGYGEDFTFKNQTLMYEYLNGKHVSPDNHCDELLTQLQNNMVKGVAGAVMDSDPVVKGMNVSFGEANDGFYQKNPHLIWPGQVGYGTPPVDGLSTTALIIIITCLGLPFFLILLGTMYLCVKKYKEQKTVSKYGRIN